MLNRLPKKYYLTHADELFHYVAYECAHLLQAQHKAYIKGYHSLSGDAQCLLIRFLSRKPRFLKLDSLNYPEIGNLELAITELIAKNYISHPNLDDWPLIAPYLSKAELVHCLRDTPMPINTSVAKSVLLKRALKVLHGGEEATQQVTQQFLARRQQGTVDYIMFLFFGDLRNHLQKFAMRDLGVLRTRTSTTKSGAQFASRDQAHCAFKLQSMWRDSLARPEQLQSH